MTRAYCALCRRLDRLEITILTRRNQMKVRVFAFAAAMAVLCLTADSVFAAQAPRLRIITTTFPLYDWTRQILGKQLQDVELIQLQDNGVDLHNFQPSVRDIARIAQCDLFVFVGGESDEWVETALRSMKPPMNSMMTGSAKVAITDL